MTFWSKRSRRSPGGLDDFADAIHGELAESPVPPAGEELLARILESRRRGARVLLPLNDGPRRRRALLHVSAVAAAAVVVMATQLIRARHQGVDRADDSWFVSEHAYARATRPPGHSYAPALATRADRLRPLELRYARRWLDGAGAVRERADMRIAVARDVVDGAPAWRVAATTTDTAGTRIDSVWMRTGDLAILRRVAVQTPYRRYDRIVVRQVADGLHLTGEMRAFLRGEVAARRTFERALPSAFAPYISDGFVPISHMAVALHPTWTGSVSVLGWAVRDYDVFVPVDLRVDGEETVRVPAGEFACWRIAIRYRGRSQWYWVRKSDGIGVRALDSTDVATRGVREMVLIAE
jgi:hypothetical protein